MMDVPAIRPVFLANNRRDHHEIPQFEVGLVAEGLRANKLASRLRFHARRDRGSKCF